MAVAAVPVIVQGVSDGTYTATATYQRPTVTTLALNDVSLPDLDHYRPTVRQHLYLHWSAYHDVASSSSNSGCRRSAMRWASS